MAIATPVPGGAQSFASHALLAPAGEPRPAQGAATWIWPFIIGWKRQK
jgi:hypothetical protein